MSAKHSDHQEQETPGQQTPSLGRQISLLVTPDTPGIPPVSEPNGISWPCGIDVLPSLIETPFAELIRVP